MVRSSRPTILTALSGTRPVLIAVVPTIPASRLVAIEEIDCH
jgi:hypothetical protein